MTNAMSSTRAVIHFHTEAGLNPPRIWITGNAECVHWPRTGPASTLDRETQGMNEASIANWRGRIAMLTAPLVLVAATSPTLGGELLPRVPPPKPAQTIVGEMHEPSAVVVKFAEGTDVRFNANPDGSSIPFTMAPRHAEALEDVLRSHAVSPEAIERLFTRSEDELDAERREAEQLSGRKLADLNLYYRVKLLESADTAGFCDALNALLFIELAQPVPRPAPPPALPAPPPPTDIPPKTPDFSSMQQYRGSTRGVGADDVKSIPGADGSGISIVDIEYQWVLDHEDLDLPPTASIDSATIDNPYPQNEGNHGTAVLGELGAKDNGYGVTGLSPGAVLKVAPQMTIEFGFRTERAVSLATSASSPGDVILMENQTCVCNIGCPYAGSQEGLGPSEWYRPVYDAIEIATARGIIVVAAAGNGSVDLDQNSCNNRFNLNVYDSGAIIVGAGRSTDRSPHSYSSYGSRVDVHAWGDGIVTTGYGSLFDPGDIRQRYMQSFGGTSGASPMVASAVAIIQGILKARGQPPMKPRDVRSLLVTTGTPQGGGTGRHIGPRPNLVAAAKELGASKRGI